MWVPRLRGKHSTYTRTYCISPQKAQFNSSSKCFHLVLRGRRVWKLTLDGWTIRRLHLFPEFSLYLQSSHDIFLGAVTVKWTVCCGGFKWRPVSGGCKGKEGRVKVDEDVKKEEEVDAWLKLLKERSRDVE